MNDSGKSTIDEVAKRCGVSKTTISRYLNGRYDAMSEKTRERIKTTIETMNYRPNRTAQRLKSSRKMLIGCVVSDISSPFSALLLRGITRVCDEAGYQVLFMDSRNEPKLEYKAIEEFLETQVDGLIINTTSGNDDYLLHLHDNGVPIVLADRELGKSGLIDTVTTPSFQDSYNCVKFLFSCGYDHVAFFSEQLKGISPRINRNDGYVAAIRDLCPHGTKLNSYQININEPEAVKQCLTQLKDEYSGKRLAILSVNGVVAQSILICSRELGIEIGKDLGLCTFDDWDYLKLYTPTITAVAMGTEEIGVEAAKLLLDRLYGKLGAADPPVCIELPTKLMVRDSTCKV